jgi:hypothetical protein
MNLLYYPTIAIPIDELKKYVLYADRISSIVPDEFSFIENSDNSQWNESITSITYLEKIGIYEKTYSSTILFNHRDTLTDEFMKRIIKEDVSKKVKGGNRPSNWWKLYLSKMDYPLIDMLLEEGLAEKSERDTIYVASEIACIYMGLLAEYGSTYGENFYSTVTEDIFLKN